MTQEKKRRGLGNRLFGLVILLIVAMTLSARNQPKTAKPQIRKFVTPGADFVLYLPQGWNCTEKTGDGYLSLIVEDPSGLFGAVMDYGFSRQAGSGQAKLMIERLARQFPTLRLANSMRNNDYSRVVFDGLFTDPAKGKREFRCWVTNNAGNFLCSRIEGPEGRLGENREMLLSVLANVRLIKGAFRSGASMPVALVPHQLSDGSASFQLPQGWRVQDLGKTQFIAVDPSGRFSFMVARAEMITPRLGVRSPGILVLPYMSPHDAMKSLCAQLGIATNMQFLWINRHQDMEQSVARTSAAGMTSAIEDFLYTCDGKVGRSKGFTFGMCFYSRLGTNWSMNHFTVGAPEDQFDAFSPNFANMLQSYRINEAWVSDYISRGLENLRRLERQTSEIVTRNAQEIHSMIQAAYEERQRSQDYIDYQRTNYIRGEQDWISSVEGGTVYHSDTWGLTNTAIGEFSKGQPFDYVHFQGENPKYRETMISVDNRELWQKYVQGK